jgi:hypothetical protein
MKIKNAIIILFVSLIIIGLFGCSSDKKAPKEVTNKERKLQLDNIINKIANKYNADITFREGVNFERFPYTIEMNDILMPKDNRPIVIHGFCSDVVKRDNKYFISFAQDDFKGVSVIFELESSKEQVSKLLKNNSLFNDEYVVIAKITKFEKIKKLILDNQGDYYEERCTDNCHCYKANGLCIDMIPIELN